MISFELAKQLKDAGFPQHKPIKDFDIHPTDIISSLVKVPTLSELIEACGDDFHTLVKCGCDECKWNCHGSVNGPHHIGWNDEDWARSFDGMSPEEAVSQLYLALHKNES